jgi:hypothetical protein
MDAYHDHVDWDWSPATEEFLVSTFRDLTVEHLGPDATERDLDELRTMVETVADRYGIDVDEALDAVWGNGDYIRNYRRLMARRARI